MNAKLPSFSFKQALAQADETLRKPPRWEHARRVAPVGERVARFALPLELCLTSNERMRGGLKQRFLEAGIKKKLYDLMRLQNSGRNAAAPLGGRPQVLAIRFSSRETDVTSDWSKMAIDRLLIGKHGLGFLVDDSPRYADVNCWCEFASPGKGAVVIEVWTGAVT
jgi:hypothetical protein